MIGSSEKEKIQKKRLPGRPKKTVSKSDFLMVRLTPTERVLIDGRAKKAGLKTSEWFRRAAKSAKVFPRFTVEEAGWFRMLAGLANNLNQLTHLAHVAGLFSLALKCQALLKQIEELLNKISSHDR
ncbi:MobC family plasmid mobilization relaxosome protein [Mucilaginibacter sp. SJ]|uniref:MobC family plasmid mobilization relaxosome protein n=1 Tax=Mucilaginibacter sp. SJ TaxID=3029053 RepID=UPI0023A96A4B|nr:MobC family plasmid mobilization relaxosome protein [Mucilaginibacter sp. SJ]WEA01853.1 MobC family plasmid mobilization relaxosome protein [Mucilaginibacter sp. SJ]